MSTRRNHSSVATVSSQNKRNRNRGKIQRRLALELNWLMESLENRVLLSLLWTRENTPDSNTLALYHFNETSGTTAVNAQGNATRNLTLGSASMITTGLDFLGRTG